MNVEVATGEIIASRARDAGVSNDVAPAAGSH
jgi:hypothetical protein